MRTFFRYNSPMNKNTDWKEKAEILRLGVINDKPPLKIERVMELLGYKSKASAEYALSKMFEAGLVKWIASGEKGKGTWYLA